jgi:hypothetical protein
MAAAVDLEEEQRGAVREGSRAACSASGERRGAEQGTRERGEAEEPWRAVEDEQWRTRGSTREEQRWRGFDKGISKPRQEGEGHMGRLVGWASPLLTPPFFFFFSFLFFLHQLLLYKLLFKFFLNS